MTRRGTGARRLLKLGVLVYRIALRLYPPSFRREWGGAMVRVFVRRSSSGLRARGTRGLLIWWKTAAADTARSLVREWWDVTGEVGMWGSPMGLGRGLRQALRRYSRTPAWTLAALATLTVGIGATTGMVSLVWESLIRPLPFRAPDELFEISPRNVEGGEARRFSLNLVETWQDEGAGGITLAGFSPTAAPMDLGRGPEYVSGGYATGNLMTLLGVRPLLGRVFEQADGREGASPAMVLSQELWRTDFGADPGVLGRTLEVGSRDVTIVGVVGPELATLVPDARFWMSTATFPRSPDITALQAVGRASSAPGVAALNQRLAGLRVTDAAGSVFFGRAEPLRDALVQDMRTVLLVFLAVVAGLLVIGVVNLSNLFLGRAVTRDSDRAIRRALGASRGRLAVDAILDGAVLGLLGGGAGLLLGGWLQRIVVSSSPAQIPGVGVGSAGLVRGLTAVGLAVLLCVGLSWATAARGSGGAARSLAGSRRTTGARAVRNVQRGLTVVQVAATFVLLVGSALLIRTFARLSSREPGFDAVRTAGLRLSLPVEAYPDTASWKAFTLRLVDEVTALPGVEAASAADRPLLKGLAMTRVGVEGDAAPDGDGPMDVVIGALPGFLDAMGIPLLRGRGLGPGDTEDAPPVAVVTESFVARHFPGSDGLGRRFRMGSGPWISVVGVIPDLRVSGPALPAEPVFVQPMGQADAWNHFISVVLRAPGDPASALDAARTRLHEIEPGAAVYEMGTYAQWLDQSPTFAETRFRALVVGLLGAVALILALIGVYGITAYSVRRRTRELGIRLALGGRPRRVLAAVLGEGLRLAVVGIALGALVAWPLVGALVGLLEGLPARDPLVFGVVGAMLATVAGVACLRPALAASRVAPVEALREE